MPPSTGCSPAPVEKTGYTRQALSAFHQSAGMSSPSLRRMVAVAGDTTMHPQRPTGFSLNNSPASAQASPVLAVPERFVSTSVGELPSPVMSPARTTAFYGGHSGYTRAPFTPGAVRNPVSPLRHEMLPKEDFEASLSRLHPKQLALRGLGGPIPGGEH